MPIHRHGAVNEYKALKPVFEHLRRLGFIRKNPLVGIELDKPKIQGFPVADAEDIAAFQERWPVGTRERLIFDLGLYTGAARTDLAKLGRKNIKGDLLVYERQKSGIKARAAGMASRLHGLRKAFCIYWAENDATTHQIAAVVSQHVV